jgi:hypothetical protein
MPAVRNRTSCMHFAVPAFAVRNRPDVESSAHLFGRVINVLFFVQEKVGVPFVELVPAEPPIGSP